MSLFAFDVTGEVVRNRNHESSLRISAAFMSSLDMEETRDVILENLALASGADTGVILMIEDEQWVAKAGLGNLEPDQVDRIRIPYDDLWPAVEAVLSRRARITTEPLAGFIPRASDIPSLQSDSNLVVPLITGNRAIGAAWCVNSEGPLNFSEDQIGFATMMGAQAALAIENASIYENEREMRKSLEAIEAISEAGLVSLDLQEVLFELVTRTQNVMQMDAAMILMADTAGEYLEARAAAGSLPVPVTATRVKVGEGLAGMAFNEDTPMKIDNLSGHEAEICAFGAESGIRSVLAVPLRIEGRIAGILQIGSLRKNAFSAREWGLIQVLADRASLAVHNSMLHEQTKQELARIALLRDVASACAGTQDMKLIARRALEAVYEQLGCATAGIFFHDRKNRALVNLAFLGHPPEAVKNLEIIEIDRDTLLNKAVVERAIITHDNWPVLTEGQAQVLADLGVLENRRAALPIVYKDEVVGGMAMTMPGKSPWSKVELDTLKSIANQMAVAMRNAELPRLDYSPSGCND